MLASVSLYFLLLAGVLGILLALVLGVTVCLAANIISLNGFFLSVLREGSTFVVDSTLLFNSSLETSTGSPQYSLQYSLNFVVLLLLEKCLLLLV